MVFGNVGATLRFFLAGCCATLWGNRTFGNKPKSFGNSSLMVSVRGSQGL
jgi:hypothetical protein